MLADQEAHIWEYETHGLEGSNTFLSITEDLWFVHINMKLSICHEVYPDRIKDDLKTEVRRVDIDDLKLGVSR